MIEIPTIGVEPGSTARLHSAPNEDNVRLNYVRIDASQVIGDTLDFLLGNLLFSGETLYI